MKYQRLEIEKIEFGDSDFMVSSGNFGSVHECFSHSISYYVLTPDADGYFEFAQTTCNSVSKSGGTYTCMDFDMRAMNTAVTYANCGGYSFSCLVY